MFVCMCVGGENKKCVCVCVGGENKKCVRGGGVRTRNVCVYVCGG